jgi:hypothetical protein
LKDPHAEVANCLAVFSNPIYFILENPVLWAWIVYRIRDFCGRGGNFPKARRKNGKGMGITRGSYLGLLAPYHFGTITDPDFIWLRCRRDFAGVSL